MYNFDEIIDRKNVPSSKWYPNYLNSLFGSTEVLPFWIADMDFKAPDCILEAIKQKTDYGILAYEYSSPSFYNSLISWVKENHHYELLREHIAPSPSIGCSVGVLINAFSEEGDGIITQPPVFMEYKTFIKSNNRNLIKNKLIEKAGVYSIDFNDLETKCQDPKNKILIVCNPHNPIGQIWNDKEMIMMAEICQRNGVLLVSDEVHADIVYGNNRFNGYLSIPDNFYDTVVSLYSPVKTFNLGGFSDSFIFMKDQGLKEKITSHFKKYSLGKTNGMVRAGLEGGFTSGNDWVKALINYLDNNIDIIESAINDHQLPIRFNRPVASYQLWLDFRETEMDPTEVHQFLTQKAKLALNPGYWFGREGKGFSRMNIASPAAVIKEGMERLVKAFG